MQIADLNKTALHIRAKIKMRHSRPVGLDETSIETRGGRQSAKPEPEELAAAEFLSLQSFNPFR
jgi:hypothetical protein